MVKSLEDNVTKFRKVGGRNYLRRFWHWKTEWFIDFTRIQALVFLILTTLCRTTVTPHLAQCQLNTALTSGLPWVWGFPWGFQWGFLWIWDRY